MFEHENFDVYSFESIPLNRDCYLMDEACMAEYEQYMLRIFSGSQEDPVGYISYAAVRAIRDSALELSWYPNVYDRFHEVAVTLNRADFIACVGSWRWSEKPHIFVKRGWLDALHLKRYSVFGVVDAIGVKDAIQNGTMTRDRLIALREAIDGLGKSYPQVSFISFADNVLLKSNWSVGHMNSEVRYSYQPEIFLPILKELQRIFSKILELSIYAVLTQGHNEYYDDAPLHISVSQNHVCLNSLGVPFAQLLASNDTARANIHNEVHPPAEVYLDEQLFRSLRFRFEFMKEQRLKKYSYYHKMSKATAFYYTGQLQEILDNLDSSSSLNN